MPRKTAKKPTTKKAAARKTAPKRKAYQTGGAAKTMRPGTMQSMPLATGQRMATAPAQTSSQEAERKRQEMIRRDRAMMEVGNRQRAAAMDAARKRAYNQATATTQRPVQGPSRAQAARNRAEYEAAMRARQQRGSTPARPRVPTAQQRADYQRMLSEINRSRVPAQPPSYQPPQRPQMRVPTAQELAQLRANPNRPSMAKQALSLIHI